MKLRVIIFSFIITLFSTYAVQSDSNGTIVDIKAAKELFDRGVLFIDVRSADRFKYGRVPGAVNIDAWGDFEDEIVKVAKKDQEIVIYCNGIGCSRSPRAISTASSLGYKKIYYFEEGWPAWLNAKYPREK